MTRVNPASVARQSSSPVPSAEPGSRIKLLMFTLEDGKMSPYGTVDVCETALDAIEEAIEKVAGSQPNSVVEFGRPGSRLIVTEVDLKDPDFVGTSEDRLEVGEIVTVPLFVKFINQRFPKFSPTLVRYYLNLREPCKKGGYTVRALEHFLHDLKGPAARDFQNLAEAHCAWAQSNGVTPFQ